MSLLSRSACLQSRPSPAKAPANRGLSLGKPAAGARRYRSLVSPPNRRVLFVEDERAISEPFSQALAREGFEPVVAAHGRARRSSRRATATPTSSCST